MTDITIKAALAPYDETRPMAEFTDFEIMREARRRGLILEVQAEYEADPMLAERYGIDPGWTEYVLRDMSSRIMEEVHNHCRSSIDRVRAPLTWTAPSHRRPEFRMSLLLAKRVV